MKSIIGPSSTHSKINSSQNSGIPPNSGSSMAVVGNPAPPMSLSSGNLFGLNDDIGEDFLNSMGNWDSPADNSLSSVSGSNNMNFSMSSGNSATSMNQSWNTGMTHIKLSQVQQQIHRSISSGGQGQGAAMATKRSLNLQSLNQRSSSLDMGQKSPGYSQGSGSRTAGFQLPGQRVMGYGSNQRSPVASPSPHSQGRFSVPFPPPRTPSPMHSPSPGKRKFSIF